jgi:hypothetical protein
MKTTKLTFSPAQAVVTGHVQFSIELKDWDGEGNRAHSVGLFGWCLSSTGKGISIEFYLHGTAIASAPLQIERPDVAAALAQPDTSLFCGFHLRLSKLALPREAELELRLWEEREDGAGARVSLGLIAGLPPAERATEYAERYNPLLVLGMGRSGTSFLMRLLAAHPDILVPGPHPYEMRQPVWLWHAAHVLSSPASTTSMSPDGFESHEAERLGYNPYRSRDWEKIAGAGTAMQWQEETLPVSCIDFCKRQVDAFVDQCCEGRDSPPRYVAQKMLLSQARYLIGNIYSDAREIFLVRDFRDVWLSARSFNSTRGGDAFERDRFSDDLSWLRGLSFSSRQIRLAHTAAGTQALLVRYEDLMHNPINTLTSVLEGLALNSSQTEIQKMVAVATDINNTKIMTHRTTTTKDGVSRWRSEMTPEEKLIASDAFGEDLRYFGYESGA